MELAELLEREGVDPDELMTWARRRADTLVAGIVADQLGEPLLRLLTGDGSIDIAAVPVMAEPVAELPVPVTAEPTVDTVVDAEIQEDTVVEARHEVESSPITVDELPPPPDPPQLAEGEPEPLLETFDTGPIDLETPEAAALMAATQAPELESPVATLEETRAEPPAEDELEEIELDELVEIAEDELEELEEIDEPESPLPPRRPPPPEPAPIRTGDTASFAVVDQAPVRTGDTAAHSVIAGGDDELEDVDLDAPPARAGGDDDFDLDLDSD